MNRKRIAVFSLLFSLLAMGLLFGVFAYAAQSLTAGNVTLSSDSFVYNGTVQQPAVTVSNGAGTTLEEGTDYTLAFSSGCKLPGTFKATVTGKGDYSGTVTKSFVIQKQPLDKSRVTLSADTFLYNGTVQKPTVTVKNANGATMTLNSAYTVAYSAESKAPGTYTVTVSAKGVCYSGSVQKTYTIESLVLDDSCVTLSDDDFVYNGTIQKPAVTVRNSAGTILENGTDYTLTFATGCKLPGTHTVTVEAAGNYTGTVTKSFIIRKQPLVDSRVTLSADTFLYNGTVQKPTVTVKNANGATMTLNNSYTVAYSAESKAPGTYTVTVSAKGACYSGSVQKTYTIEGNSLDDSCVTLSADSFVYNSAIQKPAVTVRDAAGTLLKADTDYSLAFSSGCKLPGTYTVTVTGKGSLLGTVKKTFTINKQPLEASRVTLSAGSFVYNGTSQKPTVTVKNAAGGTMTLNSSYTVHYSSSVSKFPGTYTVTITAKGVCYSGTLTKTYTIKKQPLDASRVTLGWTEAPYNGETQHPDVEVKNVNGGILTLDKHYTLKYAADSAAIGTYSVVVTGKGNFSGSVTKTYSITQQTLNGAAVSLSWTSSPFNGSAQQPEVVAVETLTGAAVTENDYSVSYSANSVNSGSYEVTLTGKGRFSGSATATYTITPQPLSAPRVTLSAESFVYNGAVQQPNVTVNNASGEELAIGTDYTLTFSSGCKTPGTYKAIVTGAGNYMNTVTKYFTIEKQPLEESRVTLSAETFAYTGTVQKPTVTVRNAAGGVMTLNSSYTVAYSDDSAAPGTYTVTVSAKGACYSGFVTKEYTILAPVELNDENITLAETCFQYDGTQKIPEITVTIGSVILEEGVDYTIGFPDGCIENGTHTVTVTGINRYAGEASASFTISETGHTPETIPAVEAGCATDGATEGVRCAVCGTVLTAPSAIPALGHEMTAVEAKEATCTEDGNNAYYHCSRCDKAFTDAAGENETTVEAQTIAATGHSYLWKVIPATCTEKAQVQKICDACNTIFDIVYDETSSAVGHSGENHVAASCTEDGYNEINCTNTFEIHYYYDEALTEAAFDEDLTCGYMEKTYIAEEPALGHDVNEAASAWTEVTPATCLAGGTESQVCARCHQEVIRETEALGHAPASLPDQDSSLAATCTTPGYKAYLCTRCGEIARQLPVEPTHTFSSRANSSFVKGNGNCLLDGYKIFECTNGCTIAMEDLAVGNVVKTSVAKGSIAKNKYGQITAISEGGVYTLNFVVIGKPEITQDYTAEEFTTPVTRVDIDAVGPTEGHQATLAPGSHARTCTEDGVYIYSGTCTKCSASIEGQTITVKAVGHIPNDNQEPTCTDPVYCKVCKTEVALPALGHDYVVPGCVLTTGTANGFYCQRCGTLPAEKSEKTAALAGVLNLIKSPAYATKRVSSFSKSKMSTSYSKFDFGIYTSVVKDYYEKEVAAVTVDYDPLETASIFELFPLRNRSYAVKPTFTEDDVKNIKIEQLSGMNTNSILTGYDEQDPTKGASTVMPNISSFRNKTINEKIIKVTLALKNETYQKNGSNIPTGSTINSYGQKVYNEDTHTSKIFDYDIRKIVDNAGFDAGTWQISEGGSDDGYEMKMTLNYIKADTILTYYIAADDYQPIAAICNINETMDQDLSMKIMTIDGVIKPMITTERSYVYLFSDFFNGLS